MTSMRPCPDPRLHEIADAPLRPLSDLLTAAVLFDEVADDIRPILGSAVLERLDALRAAVRKLQ